MRHGGAKSGARGRHQAAQRGERVSNLAACCSRCTPPRTHHRGQPLPALPMVTKAAPGVRQGAVRVCRVCHLCHRPSADGQAPPAPRGTKAPSGAKDNARPGHATEPAEGGEAAERDRRARPPSVLCPCCLQRGTRRAALCCARRESAQLGAVLGAHDGQGTDMALGGAASIHAGQAPCRAPHANHAEKDARRRLLRPRSALRLLASKNRDSRAQRSHVRW